MRAGAGLPGTRPGEQARHLRMRAPANLSGPKAGAWAVAADYGIAIRGRGNGRRYRQPGLPVTVGTFVR